MSLWSGSIALDPDRHLEGKSYAPHDHITVLADPQSGIELVDPNSHWQSDISKEANLNLRSFVNPALIPLHARAGPNLELHTNSAGTAQWFQTKMTGTIWLGEDELDLHQSLQCPVGLLVSVDGSTTKKTGAVTSDLLVYGVISNATSCARPPTPPHSSPSEVNNQSNMPPGSSHELRIYAAPLSTSLLTQAQAFPSPPPSSNEEHSANHARCAEFLPDISSPSPKRKRVATLFEVAAQHHRRVRQKGGEAVSQLMAPSRPLSSSQNLQSLRIKREPEEEQPSLPTLDRLVSHRSRSVSIGANLHRPGSTRGTRATPGPIADPQKHAPTPNSFLEPSARREQLTQQQSSLSSEEKEKPSSTPSSPSNNTETTIAENKKLITRTILTCMRLYGFHRTNPRSASSKPSLAGPAADADPDTSTGTPAAEGLRAETPAPALPADDDEFKAMYHATYKAAAFALRKFLKESPAAPGSTPPSLQKEKAMAYIDEFLRLFCEEH
ncbi:hypothetical protein NUU61_007175 [Penicillium alfredii]|uniref:Sld7 C-terminal domain-containing protein n=1 Tax=Penicillium alfredii TaxID=1506179 RepID=A0A9W9F2J6_9EURO|nr:uncharacterized protein NUU61_007175 [Penicillium alfredii]KAJ5092305.1 hypothetical protein NUU61_007175 [Penicillium alfredii]